jgi:hypothetical protein
LLYEIIDLVTKDFTKQNFYGLIALTMFCSVLNRNRRRIAINTLNLQVKNLCLPPPIIPKTLAVSAFTAFLSLSATSVSAINITGVTATTDMGTTGARNIQNTVNGAGLPSNTPSLTGLHAVPNASNAWFSRIGTTTGNITFDLGGSYTLTGFSFWNYNEVGIRGIKDVSILTSTDGLAYTSLAGAPSQFAIGANFAPQNPEQFTFSPTTTSFVRFTVASNWSDINNTSIVTGFSEVQFDGTAATPVPFDFDPSLGVVSLGVVFGINKWRKNRSKAVKK